MHSPLSLEDKAHNPFVYSSKAIEVQCISIGLVVSISSKAFTKSVLYVFMGVLISLLIKFLGPVCI